jgi:hypothetical protein
MQDVLGKMRWIEVAILIPAGMGIIQLLWLWVKTRRNPFLGIIRYYRLLGEKKKLGTFWFLWALSLAGRPLYMMIVIFLGSLTWSVLQSLKVFLLPVVALFVLSENTLKRNYLIAFALVLAGVAGSNLLKTEGSVDALAHWPFIIAALFFIFLNCFGETIGKKIHLKVGEESHDMWYILSVNCTDNLLQIVSWTVVSLIFAFFGLDRFHRFFEPASPSAMFKTITSAPGLNILAYVAMAALYFYIETFIRTLKEFPIAFKEPLIQLKIIFTAIFLSLAAFLPISLRPVQVTPMHFLFYGLILAGVTLLSLSHWKNDRAAKLVLVSEEPDIVSEI